MPPQGPLQPPPSPGDAHAVLGELRLLVAAAVCFSSTSAVFLVITSRSSCTSTVLACTTIFCAASSFCICATSSAAIMSLQTTVEAVGVVGVELALRGEALLVVGDEVEALLGRDVVVMEPGRKT